MGSHGLWLNSVCAGRFFVLSKPRQAFSDSMSILSVCMSVGPLKKERGWGVGWGWGWGFLLMSAPLSPSASKGMAVPASKEAVPTLAFNKHKNKFCS